MIATGRRDVRIAILPWWPMRFRNAAIGLLCVHGNKAHELGSMRVVIRLSQKSARSRARIRFLILTRERTI